LALAGQADKTALLASGFPVYFDMAEDIYGKPKGTWAVQDKVLLDKFKHEFPAEYAIGKNTVLGCGFQMGAKKFHDRYCPRQPMEFAERVIQTYREEWAPKVRDLWYALQRESLRCVKTGQPTKVYGVVFKIEGDFLTATLPNNWQKLWYYRPMLATGRFGEECWQYLSGRSNGGWVQMYGGIECENIVQALARGLLCAAIDRLEKAGFPVVLTVHDEIICEVDEWTADRARFEELMAAPTVWSDALGIPIAVESWEGYRYKK
jgi:hypothetical protein